MKVVIYLLLACLFALPVLPLGLEVAGTNQLL